MSLQQRNSNMSIGLDRLVRLQWLEQTALLALAGNDTKLIKSRLQEDLKTSFRSSNTEVRGSINKTVTILTKIWVNSPADIESLRIRGLDLLKIVPRSDRVLIHWGMVTAVYPFWSNVATQVGRLLRLQGTATAAHIQRRICEQYGERETVSRRARYVLRSFVDWGVLLESKTKGLYSPALPVIIQDSKLIGWVIEASLYSRDSRSAPLKDLVGSPSLFPFQLKLTNAESIRAESLGLDIPYDGLNGDMVMLRKQATKRNAR